MSLPRMSARTDPRFDRVGSGLESVEHHPRDSPTGMLVAES